ncbi:MAG: T9SS type A sorting domain-containing protein, partial [Ignavibacteriaceae bacterium]|nr:T9SS type A sorting domain-containing protein [Ignavibacteriaceae bacterium]
IILIGGTELNGNGCVCHTIERDTSVNVWVEGPDTLLVGQTGYYRMYMTGGPAEAGGYNVAGRFGEMQLVDSFSVKHSLAPNELTQAFSLPFPTTQDTIYWAFGYTASDSSAAWDTIYSCGLSLVWDSIPDPFDRWNFGHKFPVKIETLTDVDDNIIVEKFQLFQNYPNPFNPKTILRFRIGDYGYASLKVYDVIGNEVAILVDKELAAGEHEIVFDANQLSGGIYFYKLDAGSYSETKKMLLLK